ncbi:MAG TPA: type II toxin-antitoxin system VapC family toxin [Solirubrobacteraceae bacterium]|nr:type II toxin-antitoxin system VapC family toxin [Solirubrobacteraceae bacterium]
MSRLLVDTHAVLWWLADDPALSSGARAAIADPSAEPLVSAASLWEIAVKRSLGKLRVPDDLPDEIAAAGFGRLPVSPEHAWAVRGLPFHHRDPFDRLLVAQAQAERLPVVTADVRFAPYGVETRW